jgi:hypothetical protein
LEICLEATTFTFKPLEPFNIYEICLEAFVFFPILTFLIIILEMNPVKRFFLNLAHLSHVNPSGVTYEGVVPI